MTSPMGTKSKLLSKRPFDNDVAGFHAWPFMSVHFWGEMANGTWTLTVHSGHAVGLVIVYIPFIVRLRWVSFIGWSLTLYGVSSKPPHHPSLTKSAGPNPSTPRSTRERHPLASMLEEHEPPGVLSRPKSPQPQSSIGFNAKSPSAGFPPDAYAVEIDGNLPLLPPPFQLPFDPNYMNIWSESIIDNAGNDRWHGTGGNNHRSHPILSNGVRNGIHQYQNPYAGGYGLERLNSPRKSTTSGDENGGVGGWQRIDLPRQSAGKSVKSSSVWWLKDKVNGASTDIVATWSSLFAIFYTFVRLLV
ncbi:unnamed protein product [Rodentolepis nana]|uniref:P/Homo B domain-containing protein n=1 Tax=Rodentolepis nana TaxID=102285 RepID=A0A3P7SPP0_RODNA|nr:unnamed protein product [Rodentolepis nana]